MTKRKIAQTRRASKKRAMTPIERAAKRAGIKAQKPKDTNVHQHLLRTLRRVVAESFGMNPGGREPSPSEIISAAVSAGCDELELLQELMEGRDDTDMLACFVESIRRRFDLARMLGDGSFEPDRPYVLASAACHHPRGIKAGLRESVATAKELGFRAADGAS